MLPTAKTRRLPAAPLPRSNGLRGTPGVRRMYAGLYTAMAFLTVRNLFRFAEFAQATALSWPAPDGTYVLSEQEVLFYCLDTVPILLVFACYILAHPGHLLPPGGPPPRGAQDAEAAAPKEEGSAPGSSMDSLKVSVVDG